MTDIIDHYAKLANSYASRAGQLYGILEMLPIITKGLKEDEIASVLKTSSDRAREIMSK